MPGGRGKLPVLAEISGPAPGDARVWSLRRADLEPLAKLRGALEEYRVVLVEGERRLAAAVALAASASAHGSRTALLECDLVQPRLALELGLAPTPGLHEYLRWEATAGEILHPLALAGPAAGTPTEPLVVIPAGRPAGDAATLTGLESFRHAIAKLRHAYDLVVVAGSGLDAEDGGVHAVAAQVDVVLAAVGADAVSGRAWRRLRTALRRLPVPARGAIVVAGPDPEPA